MSGTALYRSLVKAGAPELETSEAAADFDTIKDDINAIITRLSVLDTKANITIAILIAILLKSFFLK